MRHQIRHPNIQNHAAMLRRLRAMLRYLVFEKESEETLAARSSIHQLIEQHFQALKVPGNESYVYLGGIQ